MHGSTLNLEGVDRNGRVVSALKEPLYASSDYYEDYRTNPNQLITDLECNKSYKIIILNIVNSAKSPLHLENLIDELKAETIIPVDLDASRIRTWLSLDGYSVNSEGVLIKEIIES